MRHIIPAENRGREMDSAIHGLLPGDVSLVNTKATAEVATVLMICVWEKSWFKESAGAVEKRQEKK